MPKIQGRRAADLMLDFELLQIKLDLLEAGRRPDALDAWRFGNAFSIKLKLPYTVSRVCRVWGFSRSTVFRKLKSSKKTVPAKVIEDEQIAEHLRKLIRDTPFPAERHRKLWARLCRQGVEVSRERVRRIINEFSLAPPYWGALIKNAPNQMWGVDSAKVRTSGDGEVKVLFAVEHCTFECLSVLVVKEETLHGWEKLLSAAIRYAQPWASVALRMDNLPLFRSAEFRTVLKTLGLRPSYIPKLRPQSNGIAERFVRLLRENLLRVHSFEEIGDVERAVKEFRVLFNHQYLVGRFDYRTPLEERARLSGEDNFSAPQEFR